MENGTPQTACDMAVLYVAEKRAPNARLKRQLNQMRQTYSRTLRVWDSEHIVSVPDTDEYVPVKVSRNASNTLTMRVIKGRRVKIGRSLRTETGTHLYQAREFGYCNECRSVIDEWGKRRDAELRIASTLDEEPQPSVWETDDARRLSALDALYESVDGKE